MKNNICDNIFLTIVMCFHFFMDDNLNIFHFKFMVGVHTSGMFAHFLKNHVHLICTFDLVSNLYFVK
jgi:hypothetical protein